MKFGEEIISIDKNASLFNNYRKRVDRIFSKSSGKYSSNDDDDDDDDNSEMNARVRDIGLLKSQVSKEWELFLDTTLHHRNDRSGN